jgi:hypothetical protein
MDIRKYGSASSFVTPKGSMDISEVVRDLFVRGLATDRSGEAGYRSGYREGRLAAYADFMASLGKAGGR